MRVFTLSAILVLTAATSAPAPAQDSGRRSADSVRALDTEPSIPVVTPSLEEPTSRDPRTADPAGPGAAAPPRTGPDTPVSSADPASGDEVARTATSADAASAQGLPDRAATPRTLRAHWHVYIAFTIVWVLLFGYALSLGWRMSRLERDLTRLGGDR